MEEKKEIERIFIFEENSTFRTFLVGLLQTIGYPNVYTSETIETTLVLPDETPQISVALIGLKTVEQQQNGLKLAALLREQQNFIPIIFLSNIYDEHVYNLCRSFQPSAFLNKELSGFKLLLALEQAFLHRENEASHPNRKRNNDVFITNNLFFKTADGYVALNEHEILYIHSNLKTTYAQTLGKTYETQVQMQTLEKTLSDNFVRIHKSYLINLDWIEAIQPNESSVLIEGKQLPIGYAYRKNLLQRIKLLR